MRRPHRKSRLGCSQCRRRRVKCDETKPRCIGCQRNGLNCSLLFLTPSSLSRCSQACPEKKQGRTPLIQSDTLTPFESESLLFLPSPILNSAIEPSGLDNHSRELLHHYENTVYLTLNHNLNIDVWKTELPRLGLSYPFLMHGILALSALHLSHVTPSRSRQLSMMAVLHEQTALPIFRKSVAKCNPSAIHAVWGFSSCVVPFLLGSCSAQDKARIPCKTDEGPHWFFALRGVMSLLLNNFVVLETGPFGPLLKRQGLPCRHSDNPDDEQLATLSLLFSSPRDSSLPRSTASLEALETCEEALNRLREAFALPHHPSNTLWDDKAVVYAWPGAISPEFVDLITAGLPEALVILAFYCVLVKRLESCWFFAGIGQGMLKSIEKKLPADWLPWIKWAAEQPPA